MEVQGGQSAGILEEIMGTGIFNADGEQWKRHRKVASPEFSTRKIRDFSNTVFRDGALHLVHILDRAMVAHEPVEFQVLLDFNTIFIMMGKFHDFGKIQFRLSRPKLSLNWETGNLPK